jgi:hypothetical protein
VKRAPHLAYSRALAPYDVQLFACIEGLFTAREFASWSKLLQAMMDILNGIETATVEDAFLSWMRRLAKCTDTKGE